jgi:hypothetical protein
MVESAYLHVFRRRETYVALEISVLPFRLPGSHTRPELVVIGGVPTCPLDLLRRKGM